MTARFEQRNICGGVENPTAQHTLDHIFGCDRPRRASCHSDLINASFVGLM
jgi:hypothetical protein